MEVKTLMKTFLVEKGLWNEFSRYYTEIKLSGIKNKEKLPIAQYVPRISKQDRIKRAENIIKLREDGLTYREIGDKVGTSYENVRLILKTYTE